MSSLSDAAMHVKEVLSSVSVSASASVERKLQETIDGTGTTSSDTSSSDTSDTDTSHIMTSPEFNPIVFWSVNAIWMSILVGLIIWFWKFNGAQHLTAWSQSGSRAGSDSDLQYQNRVAQRQRVEAERKKVSPEKRRKLLGDYFRKSKVHMVVGDDDIVTENSTTGTAPVAAETVDIETGDNLEISMRSIDSGFLVLHTQSGNRRVPNCCAVCLGTYEKDEHVVWSNTCNHAFHEDCVTKWLIKMQEGNPCPCCRSVFVEIDAVKPAKTVHLVSGNTFNTMNVSVISLSRS